MLELSKYLVHWLKLDSEKGVTAIEYGLIAALIAVGIIAAVTTVGGAVGTTFGSVAAAM